ncbi:unnamed protein product, partial [Prunus brigantina]
TNLHSHPTVNNILSSVPFLFLFSVELQSFSSPVRPLAPVPSTTFSESMASNRGQGGIQQLLTAEQEAQHIVNAARSAKMARLKQAKDEAEREIAESRSQVELQFQKKVAAQSSGDSGANVKRLEHETEHKINHLSSEASRISSDVVQMLLKQVTTVKV